VILGTVWAFFALGHIANWRRTGHPTGVILACQETVLVFLFVFRRHPTNVSARPRDWAAASLGTAIPLLLRPHGWAVPYLAGVGWILQLVGGCLTVWATFALGRSFGIVAANRGIRTGGPYRVVRHPLYACYLIGQAGYLIVAISLANATVLIAGLALQVLRIRAEERILSQDESYRLYAVGTRYRLVPLVY
jgi:protein-S-isoprenylcysteine O-methyltransferase Ste14